MLQLLFTVIIELAVALLVGNIVLRIYKSQENSISICVLLGFVVLMLLSSIVSFVFPLNAALENIVILSIASVSMFFWNIRTSQFSFLRNSFFWVSVCFILLLGSFLPYIQDHFGYFIPTIKWLNEAGLVKGIANVELVLGQQSSWHILQALFDESIDFYHRLNVTLMVAFVIYIVEKKQFLLLIFLPFLMLFVQSPTPDLPVYVFCLVITNEVIFGKSKELVLLLLMSMSLVLVKITAIWIVVLPLYYILKDKQYVAISWKIYSVLVGILVLFAAKNLYTSSNVFFPMMTTYLDTLWSPNEAIIRHSSEIALLKTYDFQYSIAEIQRFSVFDKCIHWFTLSGYKKWLHISIVLSILLLILVAWRKKNKLLLLLSLVLVLKLVTVLLFSGQFRFLLDGLFVSLFLLLSHFNIKIFYLKGFSLIGIIIVIIVFVLPTIIQQEIPSFHLGNNIRKPELSCFLEPNHYHDLPTKEIKIGNVLAYKTSYHLLFNASIPCFTESSLRKYYDIKCFPQYINNQKSAGFYMKKLSAKELEELHVSLKK